MYLKNFKEAHLFQHEEDEIRLTASMGCAILVDGKSMLDGRSLVRHADHGLYKSKEEGRNRVTFTEIHEENIDITSRSVEKRRAN